LLRRLLRYNLATFDQPTLYIDQNRPVTGGENLSWVAEETRNCGITILSDVCEVSEPSESCAAVSAAVGASLKSD
jgi:hypothetical protein